MKYITVPASIMSEVPKHVLDSYGLDPRYSNDGSEVVMKLIHYEKIFPIVSTLELSEGEITEPIYPFPVYDNPSNELDVLLNSDKWNVKTQ